MESRKMSISNDAFRANRKYEGQICAICKKEIILGDFIHICPNCQSINHEECWKEKGSCISCNSLENGKSNNINELQKKTSTKTNNQNSFSQKENVISQNNSSTQNMVPCRFCKEPIIRGARKCRHCGEYQNEEDRKHFLDDSLSITDILSIVCCPGLIGLIIGTIYCSKFEVNKGVKILKYCIIWGTIVNILMTIFSIYQIIGILSHLK